MFAAQSALKFVAKWQKPAGPRQDCGGLWHIGYTFGESVFTDLPLAFSLSGSAFGRRDLQDCEILISKVIFLESYTIGISLRPLRALAVMVKALSILRAVLSASRLTLCPADRFGGFLSRPRSCSHPSSVRNGNKPLKKGDSA